MRPDPQKLAAATALVAIALLVVVGWSAAKRSARTAIRAGGPQPMGYLGGVIPYTADDAKANVLIAGPTGAGKTSGPYLSLVYDHLIAGHGASFCIAKARDADDLMKLIRRAGAEGRTIRIRPGGGVCVNPLEWFCSRASAGGAVDFDIVRFLMQLGETLDRRKGATGHGEDSYFKGFTERTLFFASACCRVAKGTVTFRDLLSFVTSLPASAEHAASEAFRTGFAGKTLLDAANKALTDYDRQVINDALDFVHVEYGNLAEKPKSCVVTSASKILHPTVYGIANELIGGRSTVNFETILKGAIFIWECSPKEYFEAGVLVQTAGKQLTQMVVEAGGGRSGVPVLLAIDEFPMFVVEEDAAAIATTRSAGLAWLMCVQTLPNLYAALGGGDKAKQLVDSLVGNVNTVIACQTTCPVTSLWLCDRIGKTPRYLVNCSNSAQAYLNDSFLCPGPPQTQVSLHSTLDHVVRPIELGGLKRGGPPAFKVGTLVTMSGRRIGPAGERHAWVEWNQWRLS
jgi:hypothetical protein